jgi:hypothetical protein
VLARSTLTNVTPSMQNWAVPEKRNFAPIQVNSG